MRFPFVRCFARFMVSLLLAVSGLTAADPALRPWPRNPFFWEYRGEPVLLAGGSSEDNLFQLEPVALKKELDALVSAGGNYVRSTLSSRDDGDVWPFAKSGELYDLNHPNAEYWKRFSRFLEWTAERGIFVQVEVWDRFDFSREPWNDNPFNPALNRNYTEDESELVPKLTSHPTRKENAFFRSVPALENNTVLLKFQEAYVDALLRRSLGFDHIFYCMDNETNESPEWGAYWASYIKKKAAILRKSVPLTEMWDDWDLLAGGHANTWKNPDLYSFVDVSQNNHKRGQKHWDNLQEFRAKVFATGRHRPLNCVKIYGADTGRYGRDIDAQERFWRNILGGVAAVRFHRPDSGLGAGELALTHIRALRMVEKRYDFFRSTPANVLLRNYRANEAYCATIVRRAFIVFLTDGGEVSLNIESARNQDLSLAWFDILANRWVSDHRVYPEYGYLKLVAPKSSGLYLALVTIAD